MQYFRKGWNISERNKTFYEEMKDFKKELEIVWLQKKELN
jgi:hypothetical protein